MLFQIHDPLEKKNQPEDFKIALGIDFGTTHCVAGYVKEGKVELIPLDNGFLLPSIVAFAAESTHVGSKAYTYPSAVHSIKRVLGRHQSELVDVDLTLDIDESGAVETLEGSKHPIYIASLIFRHIKEKSEKHLDAVVDEVVVTVPAYFDEVARSCIKKAAELAGFSVLRLVAEPTSAALAYGLDDAKEGTYIVYDLGGGTFDVSVLRMQQGVFQVLATGGDNFLGGDDIDALIVRHFLPEAKLTQKQLILARLNARIVKERLTTQLKATFDTPLGDRCVLKRENFEALIQPLIDKTFNITATVLTEAAIETDNVDGIILVGGSSRIPLIQETFKRQFAKPIYQTLDPDCVVAMGAAQQAHLLTKGGDSTLIDVTPLSLGIEMMGGVVDKIIPRNSPIPIRKGQNFTTFKDNQTGLVINIVQGEREMAADCRSLGSFVLSNIPPMPAGAARIKVVFALDADGLLNVKATEETTGTEQFVEIKPTYGLSESAMEEMILESHKYAKEDMANRLLKESETEAKQIILAIEKGVAEDSDVLSNAELAKMKSLILALQDALLSKDRELIKSESKRVDAFASEFAQRRITKHLKQSTT